MPTPQRQHERPDGARIGNLPERVRRFFETMNARLGESPFVAGARPLGSQTPMRRQMDYLRQVGGSKEAAKELKPAVAMAGAR